MLHNFLFMVFIKLFFGWNACTQQFPLILREIFKNCVGKKSKSQPEISHFKWPIYIIVFINDSEL